MKAGCFLNESVVGSQQELGRKVFERENSESVFMNKARVNCTPAFILRLLCIGILCVGGNKDWFCCPA